jgi:hypothetical protein
MKKAKILIPPLLLTSSSLWAIDAQSLKAGALDLWDKSKGVADKVDETVRDTWNETAPLRETIGEKSGELWDESELLRDNVGGEGRESWNAAKDWSRQKYKELSNSKESTDNSNTWLDFSESKEKGVGDPEIRNFLKELWEKIEDSSKQLGEKIQENTKSLL